MPSRSHLTLPPRLTATALAGALLLAGGGLHAQGSPQGGSPQGGGNPGQPASSGGGQSHGGQPQGGQPQGGQPQGGQPQGGQAHGGQPGSQPHGGYPGGGHGQARGFGPHGFAPHGAPPYRGRAGWWRGYPAFSGYFGPRPGYYYAPGYGYYAPPPAFAHSVWVVGMTLPVPMRRYVVVEPVSFGLAPPPPGFGWYSAGTNFVLMSLSSGVIVQSVAGGW